MCTAYKQINSTQFELFAERKNVYNNTRIIFEFESFLFSEQIIDAKLIKLRRPGGTTNLWFYGNAVSLAYFFNNLFESGIS